MRPEFIWVSQLHNTILKHVVRSSTRWHRLVINALHRTAGITALGEYGKTVFRCGAQAHDHRSRVVSNYYRRSLFPDTGWILIFHVQEENQPVDR